MGIIGLFNSAIGMLKTGAGLGVSQSAVRDISEANVSKDDKRFSRIISLTNKVIIITSLLGILITLALSPFLSKWSFGNNHYTIAFVWITIVVGLNILSEGQLAILKGMRQLRALAKASMIGSLVGLITAVPFYYFFGKGGIVSSLNGGITAAYNDGIRYALEDKGVDAIMLLGNDIEFQRGAIKILYDYLYSDEELGMVAPILLKKNSNEIESFGISVKGIRNKPNKRHKSLDKNRNIEMITGYVPGGISLSKRIFYEKVGFQDENLFMYGDEKDIYYRSKRLNFKQGVTSNSVAWHQHAKSPIQGERLKTTFLIARNQIYLLRKHFNVFYAILYSSYFLFIRLLLFIRDLYKKESRITFYQYCKGLFYGIRQKMNNDNLWY